MEKEGEICLGFVKVRGGRKVEGTHAGQRSIEPSGILGRWVVFICWLFFAGPMFASSLLVESEFIDEETLRFTTIETTLEYYILQGTVDLETYDALVVEFGHDAPSWDVALDPRNVRRSFYRVVCASIFTPQDSDGDYIDDVYEMNHPDILNPLDPTDASEDPDGNGLTNLQEYLRELTSGSTTPQYVSREVTAFNFGKPLEAALSREVTLFNQGSPSAGVEAISRSVSIYNGSGPLPFPEIPQAVSRELSVYNLGSPSAAIEAISKSVSVYNGSGPLEVLFMPQVISREVSLYNAGEPSAQIEAISREVSVLATTSQN